MPVLASTPLPREIAGLKGHVDIYVWRGLVCARRWPRKYTGPPSPARMAAAAAFGSLSRRVGGTGATARTQAAALAAGGGITWRDLVTSAAYGDVIVW